MYPAQTQPGAVATTLDIINRFVTLGPNRRILRTIGKAQIARRWLNFLSRSAGVFKSFDEAEKARLKHFPASHGHLNQSLISSNFAVSTKLRCSDYSVLFWLSQIAKDSRLGLFDFGGGQGQTFVAMRNLLGEENIQQWMVNDLPEVIADAPAIAFPQGKPESVEFTAELSDGAGSNVFLAAGSLHYWIQPMQRLFENLRTRPSHFLVNRSPMRSDGGTYFTVQEGGSWAVPCMVRDFRELQDEMKSLGYSLIDHWIAPEKYLHRPWLPEFSCPYQGAYFKLTT